MMLAILEILALGTMLLNSIYLLFNQKKAIPHCLMDQPRLYENLGDDNSSIVEISILRN